MDLLNETAVVKSVSNIDTENIEDVLFNVYSTPSYVQGQEGELILTNQNHVVVQGEETKPLYTGPNYIPIRNRTIVEAVKEADKEGYLQFERVRRHGNRRFEFLYTHTNDNIDLGPEKANMSLTIINSYDGSTSLHVMGGIYVLVCSNGMRAPKMIYNFKRKHTKDIGPNEFAGFISDTIASIVQGSSYFTDKVWHNDIGKLSAQFNQIKRIFPEKEKAEQTIYHPMIHKLNHEFQEEHKKYSDMSEFALFMAGSNMTSRPHEYGLSAKYAADMEKAMGTIFFN